MTTQVASNLQVPDWWLGSLPEWLVYRELARLGKRDGEHFTYQSPLMGGRIQRGGVIIDFLFYDPPDLAINVQGVYWHYGLGPEVIARDRIARAQLAGQGLTLIFIDEDDLMRNPRHYVEEALQYRDHSQMQE
mgnify:CR=1 FL=1